MNDQILRSTRHLVVIFVTIFALVIMGCDRRPNEVNPKDIDRIAASLLADPSAISVERVVYDADRNFYGVFFVIADLGPKVMDRVSRLKSYADESPERNNLYLHSVAYKQLKKLAWGPPTKYVACRQFIGVWDSHFLVYIAECDGRLYGYFESNFGIPAGSGPYN